jgi:hypothetical protein
MRWPFYSRARSEKDQAMDDAMWAADRALLDAQQMRSRATAVGDRLRETGRRNHFGEAVARAIRGD